MIRRPPRSTQSRSSAASDVYKRQAGRDQFADRLAHKARITEDVVRAEIRKAAVDRRPTLTTRELPSFGQIRPAERGLIWALFHDDDGAREALAGLVPDDFETLLTRRIL